MEKHSSSKVEDFQPYGVKSLACFCIEDADVPASTMAVRPQSTGPCISHDTMTLGHRIGTVQLSKRILTQPQHEFSDTGLESIFERRLSP